jgi:hypothetical protein
MKPDISAPSEFLPIRYVPLVVPLLGCFQVVAILLVVAFALTGCATIGGQDAAHTENRRLDRGQEIGRQMMDDAMNAASMNSGVRVPWDPIWDTGDF